MTCLVIQDVDSKSVVVKEFVLFDSNTAHTGQFVDNWLKEQGFVGHLEITGDASGVARKSSGTRSDWQILESIFKNYDGFQIKITRRNLPIKERVNNLNAMLENVKGERRLLINPKCSYTIKDFNRQTFKDDGTLNDSGNLGHRTDAVGYYVINYHRIGKRGTEVL